MKHVSKRKTSWTVCLILSIIVLSVLSGCNVKKDDEEKVRDLEFTVVGEADVPQQLQAIVAEKRTQPFKMTFTDD